MLEVCVVGLGALGALYGFLIERSGKARVTAVCRSNYDVVKSRGIDFRSEKYGSFDAWKPSRVVKTPAEAADRQYDFVICAAKFVPDLVPTTHILGQLISHASTFVLIQNGIGVHEEVRQVRPDATIISACGWVDATAVDGGKVVKHGRIDRLVLGIHWTTTQTADPTLRCASQEHLDTLVEALTIGGCHAVPADDIDAARWQKNLWNIGYSVFCTLTRSKVATLVTDKWIDFTTPVVRGFMEEAVAIARATGLTIPESSIEFAVDTALVEYAETHPARKAGVPFLPGDFKPSMLVDLELNRPMEIEGIVGGVIKKGREAGVSTPRLEMAYATLLLLQEPLLIAARRNQSISAKNCGTFEAHPQKSDSTPAARAEV